MIHKLPILTLLASLSLCSCKEPNTVSTPKDSRKLNAARAIAVEIEEEHGIEGDPYLRFDGVAQIELRVTDSKLDYESIVPKISELKSVQSFDGELQLLFQIQKKGPESTLVTNLARYNAKTGQQIEQNAAEQPATAGEAK